jgi:hypothetical protein
VGLLSSVVGTALTNGSIAIRSALGGYKQPGEDMDVVKQSVAYGLYAAISSNLRYQLIAGVAEQRILEPLLHGAPAACTAASFVVRTGNTFLGSLLWVDFLRLCGLQKQRKAVEAVAAAPAAGKKDKRKRK